MPDEEGRELELRSCSSCGRLVALDVTPDPTEPALPPALRLAPLAKCMPTGAPSAEVGS
jgi:hypothetical protein